MPDRRLPAAFVTFGWCRSAYTVCRALSARGVAVHVGDSSRLAMTRFSRWCESYTRLPDFFLSPQQYLEEVICAMKEKGATVLLPCSEDIEIFIRHSDQLPDEIMIAAPALHNWQIAEDKFRYLEPVRSAGCAVPDTRVVGSEKNLLPLAEEIGFPLVLKVRNGNGSRGVAIIKNSSELHRKFDQFISEYDLPQNRWPVLQRRIVGPKYQMDGVFVNGRSAHDGVYRILRAKGSGHFGTSTYRQTVERPDIQESAAQALRALNWHGIYNLDFICDDSGLPYLIDINGRLGGAVSILYEAGLDLPWIWYQLALENEDFDEMLARSGVATKWLLGELLAFVEHLGKVDLRGGLKVFFGKGPRAQAFDDFSLRDPLPFIFELLDYSLKFMKSGGSLRPTVKGMVR